MIGLSSVWKTRDCDDGIEAVAGLIDAGFEALELEYRVTGEMYRAILPLLKKSGIRVLSVHNYFPAPECDPPRKPGGDAFLLSSTDENERGLAVEAALASLREAAELGARAVVFHLGRVEIPDRTTEMFALYDEGGIGTDQAGEVLSGILEERVRRAVPFVDAVMRSVDRLNEEAVALGVDIGCENRYYLREIPNFGEVAELLDRFAGGRVRYWHDAGHAHMHDVLGVRPQTDWLKAYGDRMAGIHLHDAVGYSDHKPPGAGDIPFAELARYLHDDVLKIIEVHQTASREEIHHGVEVLRGFGID